MNRNSSQPTLATEKLLLAPSNRAVDSILKGMASIAPRRAPSGSKREENVQNQ